MYTTREQGYIYSIDEDVTVKKLKNQKGFKKDYNFQPIKKRLKENQIDFILEGSSEYHFKFNAVKSNPYIIYYKGDIDLLNKKLISIVWPRKKTNYADKVLEKLFSKIAWYNIATVSGMARGVDSLAHNLSIENNIPTIAVLGGGLGYTLWT